MKKQLAVMVFGVQIGLASGVASGVALAQNVRPMERPATLVVPPSVSDVVPAGPVVSGPAKTIVFTLPPDRSRRDISVVLQEGLRSMVLVPTPELRAERKAMQEGQEISEASLRSLANLWDGTAALRLVRLLETKGDKARPADIAWYGTIAVSTGRVWPLEETIAALHKLNPADVPAERLQAYSDMIFAHAWAGNSLALDAAIDLSGPGRLLGPLSAETRARLIAQDAATGDGRIALRLAIALWQNANTSVADDTVLQEYLDRAITGNNLVVKTTALNLSAQIKEKRLEQAPTQ